MSDLASPPVPPAPASVPQRPASGRVAAGVVASAAVAIVAVAAWWPQTDVVKVFRADATYGDGRQHVAVVRHVHAPISALRLSGDRDTAADHYEIVLGSDPGGDYGHHVRFDAGTAEGVDGATITWSGDGASIRYPSGHSVDVPARMFTGGR
ncbi:hypothetical protein [Cryptosporangium arvum]|uniref:hypothetical protein n=1 Tax=Cryptosporangium arvum TaxID=80871 RepID=UPI000688509B|nr:hypothetical protein [Cryptosporangium arvum]